MCWNYEHLQFHINEARKSSRKRNRCRKKRETNQIESERGKEINNSKKYQRQPNFVRINLCSGNINVNDYFDTFAECYCFTNGN